MSFHLSKSKVVFGAFVGAMLLAIYPIAVYPYMHVDEYKEAQARSRKGIKQEDVQPGNMVVWKDPFGRK